MMILAIRERLKSDQTLVAIYIIILRLYAYPLDRIIYTCRKANDKENGEQRS